MKLIIDEVIQNESSVTVLNDGKRVLVDSTFRHGLKNVRVTLQVAGRRPVNKFFDLGESVVDSIISYIRGE